MAGSPLRLSHPPIIFGLTLGIYLLAAVRLLPYVEPPTGDQPHYLLQTISLVEDGDLDLRNNYTTAESYSQFSAPGRRRAGFRGIPVSYELAPEGHIVVRSTAAGEVWYPKHGPGLPVLLVPGWLVGRALTPWLAGLTSLGNGAWPGTVFEMALIGALLAVQVWLLAWEASGRRSIAYAVWAGVSFSAPQVLTSLTLYPEAPAALASIYAFRHLVVRPLPAQTWRLMLVGLALGGLPWLNPRFVLVSGSLALLALAALWRSLPRPGPLPAGEGAYLLSRRERAGARGVLPRAGLLLGPLLLSSLAFRWYQVTVFGSAGAVADQYEGFFVPTLVDGRLSADWLGLLLASVGLLVDRQYGLLVFAPLYALAAVGLAALWRASGGRWLVVSLGIVALPYLALTADFRVWWGGWSPPARYLAVLTPLLAAPLAASLVALGGSRLYRMLFGLLGAVGLVVMALLLVQPGSSDVEQAIFSNPARNPALLRWLMVHVGVDLAPLLPGIAPWFGDRRLPIPWLQTVGCLGLLGALVGLSLHRLFLGAKRDSRPAEAADPA